MDDRPRTSLAGIFIAVTAIALALGFWLNHPRGPHPSPAPPLVGISVIAFCGALLTPYRWIGIVPGAILGHVWAFNWRLVGDIATNVEGLIGIAPFMFLPMIFGVVLGSWLRRKLRVRTKSG